MPESIGDLLGRGIVSLIESANDAIETAPLRRRIKQVQAEVVQLRAVNAENDADAARVEARQVFERVATWSIGVLFPERYGRLCDQLRRIVCADPKRETAAAALVVGNEVRVFVLATGGIDRVVVSEPRFRELLLVERAEGFVYVHGHRHSPSPSPEDIELAKRLLEFSAPMLDFIIVTRSGASWSLSREKER